MPNSKADAATPTPDAGVPGTEAKDRPPPDRRASADAPSPPNGITITRWSLALAVVVLGGAFTLVWNRTAGLDDPLWSLQDQVADMRAEISVVHHEVGTLRDDMTALRQDVRALRQETASLREEMRTEIGTLHEDMSAVRDHLQEITTLTRTRAAPPTDAQ